MVIATITIVSATGVANFVNDRKDQSESERAIQRQCCLVLGEFRTEKTRLAGRTLQKKIFHGASCKTVFVLYGRKRTLRFEIQIGVTGNSRLSLSLSRSLSLSIMYVAKVATVVEL